MVNYHLYSAALAGRVAAAGLPTTTVHMVPGPLFLEVPFIRLVERVLARLDDHIICSSSRIYQEYASLGVPRQSLAYVPYSVDFDRFRPCTPEARAAARAYLGVPSAGFVAVCVAWFYPPKRLVHRGVGIKGHDVLLRAWARFRSRGGVGTLVLAGSGVGSAGDEYRDRLRSLARHLGIEPSVRWLGHVDDVRTCYAAADVSILPSWSENYGSVGEASAMGVPTLGSRVGGIPELVVEGATGWTFPPGDASALSRLLLLSSDLARTGGLQAVGARARRLSMAMAERTQSVAEYCSVIERAASVSSTPRRHHHYRNGDAPQGPSFAEH